MQRFGFVIGLLAALGCALVVGGLLLLQDQPVQAQADEREYVGSRECSSCHRSLSQAHNDTAHALTFSEDEDRILADFSQGEDMRQVQFPGEDSLRAFTADDIAFAVGSGRRIQRYVVETGDDEYQVLPAEWNIVTGAWQPLTMGDTWPSDAYDWGKNCAGCHTTGYNVERARWEDEGVECEACHGPGSEHLEVADDVGRRPDADELLELRASINNATDPQVCGQCHSRGTGPDNLAYPAGYVPGMRLNDVYQLVDLQDSAHWWVSGHASHKNMQYNEWAESGHARALASMLESEAADASCLTCHSADYAYNARVAAAVEDGDREGEAPEPVTLETASHGVTCISCHSLHTESLLPSNLVQETYALCTSCHSNAAVEPGVHHPVQEMYEGMPFIDGIPPRVGVHFVAEDGPTCTSCHMVAVPAEGASRVSHNLNPVLPGAKLSAENLQDICSSCHGDEAELALLQKLIDDIQANTRARIDAARAAVTDTTPDWVTRALDFVEGDGSLGIHNYAYSDAVLDAVDAELGLRPVGQ